jgi:hypothetical protein
VGLGKAAGECLVSVLSWQGWGDFEWQGLDFSVVSHDRKSYAQFEKLNECSLGHRAMWLLINIGEYW